MKDESSDKSTGNEGSSNSSELGDSKDSQDAVGKVEFAELRLQFLSVISQDDPAYNPDAKPYPYTPDDTEAAQPIIDAAGGALQLSAVEVMSDGSEKTIDIDDEDLVWKITEITDDSDNPTSEILAKVDEEGKLTALGCGNGYVTLLCKLKSQPEYEGVQIKVQITNNAPAEGESSATVLAYYPCYTYNGQTRLIRSSVAGSALSADVPSMEFDVKIYFSDGTSALASDFGIWPSWSLEGQYDVQGFWLDDPLANLETSTLSLISGAGNGYVVMAYQMSGTAGTFKVLVSDNSPAGYVDPVPYAVSVMYTDVYNAIKMPYTAANPPEIITRGGTVQLVATLLWTDGTRTLASDSAYSVVWFGATSSDFDGNPLSEALADVDYSTGLVTAKGVGNGTTSFTCVVYNDDTYLRSGTINIQIRGNDDSRTVSNVEILSKSGNPYGDNGVDVAEVGNIVEFYVRVTYSDGTKVESFNGSIPGLEWHNYRSMTEENDLYSTIDASTGYFQALSGFTDCRVTAVIKNGGFYGQDKTAAVRVSNTKNTERIGETTMLTVHVVYESQYLKFGSSAPSSKDIELTASQLLSAGLPYSDWYTYHSRGNTWGTMYAYGVSMQNMLALANIDVSDMQYILFEDAVGYTGDSGFYSSSKILSSSFRYSNYYMHAASSNAGYLGQSNVVPMLALSFYLDLGKDYDGSGYSKMYSDACIRLITGMSGVDANNARSMVRCVSDVTVIVKDQIVEEEEEPVPVPGMGQAGNGGSGTGSGAGSDTGGGSGSEEGVATEGEGGGATSGGEGVNANSTTGEQQASGTLVAQVESQLYLRELVENEDETVLPVLTYDDDVWKLVTALAAIFALLLGAFYRHVTYRRDKADGERMAK
jgi:hypothetical protein